MFNFELFKYEIIYHLIQNMIDQLNSNEINEVNFRYEFNENDFNNHWKEGFETVFKELSINSFSFSSEKDVKKLYFGGKVFEITYNRVILERYDGWKIVLKMSNN